ncbi:MAG: sugar phosphate isomerase/epimerase [Clostridia bacterium]|nr:sugar phosphate isomerase/epimerase [Clostridia bacterium]
MNQIGLQLYTVRKRLNTKEESRATLEKIKEIGYRSVQLFGSGDSLENATCWAQLAREQGLSLSGILINLESCELNEQALFALCKECEIPDIGISSSPAELQELASYIERVNRFAAKARAAGFSFSFHNHAHEFIRHGDGKHAMEHFFASFSKDVDFMPDTYWLHTGGCDVRHFLEETRGRVTLLHLKDLKRLESGQTFAEVGKGNLWFKGILQTALDCGIHQFIVEQDQCDGDPLESIRISYQNAKALLEEVK